MKTRALRMCLGICLVVTGIKAQVLELPDTPAGKIVMEYFHAFNSDNESVMRQFFESYSAKRLLDMIPMDQRLQRYRQTRGELGEIRPLRVLSASESRIEVLVQSRNAGTLRFSFMVESGPPHGLAGIGIDEAEVDEKTIERLTSNAELVTSVGNYLNELTEADEFSGVVLIARRDTVLFSEAYGFADREQKIPNSIDTKFNLGSINKAFTSLAIRRLIHEGKLRMDDPLGKFLPEYPNKEAAEKVTIEQLLTMRSGIGDIFGPRYQSTPKDQLRSIQDFIPLFSDLPLQFEPGSQRRYSNGGYILLGAIIEKVTGSDYYDYIRDTIFDPAGMIDTDWYARDEQVPNRALGYTKKGDGDGRVSNFDTLPGRGSSAGGGYSTAPDLLRYVSALENELICDSNDPAREGFGIAGGAPGINASVDWDPKSGYVVIVLSNFDPPAAVSVARTIRGWLPGS